MNDDVLKMAAQDSGEVDISQDKLEAVGALIKEQIRLEDLVESLEEQKKQANKDLELIKTKKLPDAMLEANCSRFDTPEGHVIKLEEVVYASVSAPNSAVFYDWLEEEGHAGIIKSDVKILYGKGERAQAKEALERLRQDGFEGVVLDESIHWATLRAFAKEQLAEGVELPSVLTVHPVTQAKIKRKKEG